MAYRGPSRWRLVRKNFRGAGQLNAPAPNLGGVSQHPGFPSPSRTMRGDSPPSLWLYKHAAAQPAVPHNVAGQANRHLHPDLLPHEATSLGNQVACMIAEYHLTVSARQLSLCPILSHEVAPLLLPIKNYVLGVSFEGTLDVRVMDHAVALQVAV